jgi:hypothetical protein
LGIREWVPLPVLESGGKKTWLVFFLSPQGTVENEIKWRWFCGTHVSPETERPYDHVLQVRSLSIFILILNPVLILNSHAEMTHPWSPRFPTHPCDQTNKKPEKVHEEKPASIAMRTCFHS